MTKGGTGGSGGTWILTGNNTYTGVTTVNNGILQIGDAANGGTTGSLGTGNTTLASGTTLLFNRNSALVHAGKISGAGAVTVQTNTVTLTGGNNYTGGTSVSNGATLNIGNGGALASLDGGSAIVNDGFMKFNNSSEIITRFATISGTGNFEIGGTGKIGFLGPKTYTGWTLIDAGATLAISVGNETLGMATSVITNNGTLYMQRQDYSSFIITNNIVGTGKLVKDCNNVNDGDITLYGTNTYTGDTCIGSGGVILGDNFTAGAGEISALSRVIFTNSSSGNDNRRLFVFNRPDNFTFPNDILTATPTSTSTGNRGIVKQIGPGVVTLTGAIGYWLDGTAVSNGVLQVGNGGTTGAIGTNTATVVGGLVFNRSDAVTFGGGINGTGAVVQAGSGVLTLTGAINLWNTNADTAIYTVGSLTASNGTLVVTGGFVNGNVNVSGGTLAAAAIGTVGSLGVSNSLTISSGTVSVALNKSLAQSNSVFTVETNLVATGGTLKLVNAAGAPSLVVGDQFFVFNKAVTGGNLITVVPPTGVTVENDLAVNGSVKVLTAPVGPGVFTNPTGVTGMQVQNGTNLVLTATNGQSGDAYYLLWSTNVAKPFPQWKTVATNVLGLSGNYTFIGTNVVVPGIAFTLQCFELSSTNYNP